jgi:DUF4097 and DUF4098 domain-containing protein YvlB
MSRARLLRRLAVPAVSAASVALTGVSRCDPATVNPSDGPAHVHAYDITGRVTRLDVTSNHGNIVVRGTDAKTTHVKETVRYRSAKPKVTSDFSAGTLTLEGGGCGSVLAVNSTCSVDYEIDVPRGAKVTLRASAGDVTLHATTAAADLHSEAGNITADGSSSRTLTAKTDAGDVDLAFTAPPSSVDATSSAGNVTVRVPKSTYAVKAGTDLGSHKVKVTESGSSPHRLHLHSDLGDVSVLPTS